MLAKKITRTVKINSESAVNGVKCITERISPRPHTVTQSGLLSWVYNWGGGKAGIFREVGSVFGEVGEGKCETLVLCWGNGDSSLCLIDNRVYCFKPGMS